jgi:hypothetical protein
VHCTRLARRAPPPLRAAPGLRQRRQRAVRARGRRGGGLGRHVTQEGCAVGAPRRKERRVKQAHALVEAVAPPRAVVQPACSTTRGAGEDGAAGARQER